METEFEKRLAGLINEFSLENQSNTPDFILARYINAALLNFNAAINDREQWYGRIPHIEDNHYKIPFDYDGTRNPNIDPNYTNIGYAQGTIESVQPFCKPEQNQGIIIGDNKGETGDGNFTNVFIGNATGRLHTGSDSTFIGRPAGTSVSDIKTTLKNLNEGDI